MYNPPQHWLYIAVQTVHRAYAQYMDATAGIRSTSTPIKMGHWSKLFKDSSWRCVPLQVTTQQQRIRINSSTQSGM